MLIINIIQIGHVKTRHVAKQQGVGLCLIVQSIADLYSGSSVKCRLSCRLRLGLVVKSIADLYSGVRM